MDRRQSLLKGFKDMEDRGNCHQKMGSTLDSGVCQKKCREVFLEEGATQEWADVSREAQNTGPSKPEADYVPNISSSVAICLDHTSIKLNQGHQCLF